jgi:RNA polymerase sigma-70 factor (ECF subfamily)
MMRGRTTAGERARVARGDVTFAAALASAKDGAPWALRRLYDDLGPDVLAYCRASRSSDADGTANEVFLRVFRSIASFVGDETGFRSWVFTVARNVLIDDHRRAQRRVDEIDLTDRENQLRGGDVEDDALEELGRHEVRRVLARLTDEQREVVLLRVVADLSVEEVAAVTGRSAAAVKAMQHRAIAGIRRVLARDASSHR